MDPHGLFGLDAFETARLVANRGLSPVETVTAAIAAIEARNPSLNAVIFCDFDGALEKARVLEAAILRGDPVGELAGVPTLMKDLYDFKPGWPTTYGGIPALKGFISDFWSTYPERVERADAILLGKTNSPVLGFRGVTDNPLFGPTRNPFNLAKNSGGSSGGSAAAVADGLTPIAGATDGGGSIRIPASWCGVFGFQPSFGRVPKVTRPNAFDSLAPFIFEGPVARNVRDAALVMNVLAGHNPRDPHSGDARMDFLSASQRSIKGLKIGLTRDFGIFPVDPAVAQMVVEAAAAFESAGAHVEWVELGFAHKQAELSDLWCRMICAGTVATFASFRKQGVDLLRDHRSELPDVVVHWVEVVAKMTVADLHADQVMRTSVFDTFADAFTRFDLIVSPTTACLPVDNREDFQTNGPETISGEAVDPQIGWCMTYLTNLIGSPSASIPAGLCEGLPVGLQIIGRRHADADVMAASAAFEMVRPWRSIYEIPAARSLDGRAPRPMIPGR